MIIGEGVGIETDEVVTKYLDSEQEKDYFLDCIQRRKRLDEVGYYIKPFVIYDKWFPGADKSMNEARRLNNEN